MTPLIAMTCAVCGATITDERTGRVLIGTLCEVCLDSAERCAPQESEQ